MFREARIPESYGRSPLRHLWFSSRGNKNEMAFDWGEMAILGQKWKIFLSRVVLSALYPLPQGPALPRKRSTYTPLVHRTDLTWKRFRRKHLPKMLCQSSKSFLIMYFGEEGKCNELHMLAMRSIHLCPFILGSIRVGMKLLDTMLCRNRVKGSWKAPLSFLAIGSSGVLFLWVAYVSQLLLYLFY